MCKYLKSSHKTSGENSVIFPLDPDLAQLKKPETTLIRNEK